MILYSAAVDISVSIHVAPTSSWYASTLSSGIAFKEAKAA
jgi:hypothetical protein